MEDLGVAGGGARCLQNPILLPSSSRVPLLCHTGDMQVYFISFSWDRGVLLVPPIPCAGPWGLSHSGWAQAGCQVTGGVLPARRLTEGSSAPGCFYDLK